MCRVIVFTFASMLLTLPLSAQNAKKKPNPAMAKIKDQEGLPRVLLIGDSISIGYTVPVREALKGHCNVHRALTNCGPTTRGVEQVDAWIGDGKWDVIHFNFGLHDLKYMGPKNENLADPKAETSHQQVPVEQYVANLRTIVAKLKKTNAKLIWCSTTPVPEGAAGRVVGDSAIYNAAALEVMEENGIAVDDLYTFAKDRLSKIQRAANVHFSPEGSKELAGQVAISIQAALGK